MLIQIFRNSYEQGILKKERDGSSILASFMGGANVAFRREAIAQAGIYDPRCRTMEDADICIRIGKLDWELYRNPKAVVRHKNPTTLKSLIKQWKGYMTYMPYLYRKHNTKAIEIFAFDANAGKVRCIFFKPFAFPVLIVLNTTLKINLSFLFFLIFAIIKWWAAAYIILGYGMYCLVSYLFKLGRHFYVNMRRLRYFEGRQRSEVLWTLAQFLTISCIENWAIIYYSFLGGLRQRMLFLYGDPSH